MRCGHSGTEQCAFRGVVECAPDIIARYDASLRHVYVNPAVEREIGVPPDEFLGKTHREFGMPEPLASAWMTALSAVLQTARESEVEFEYTTPSGPSYYQCRISPERAADGSIVGLVAVGRNLTAQKRLEARLRETEERFRELADHLDSVFWLMEVADERLLYVSPAYARVWGRPVESVYQDPRSYFAAVHPDDRDRVREAIAQLPAEVHPFEYRVLHPGGAERWVSSRVFPVTDGEGAVHRIAGITDDITERKRAEIERERVLEVVSHDLQSPLTGVLLSADVALSVLGPGANPAAERALQTIVSAAEQMRGLISDLLDAATLTGGGAQLLPAECATDALFRAAVGRIAPIAAAHGVEIRVRDDAALVVWADPERILQVLGNLLSNAVKFTPAGGWVELRAERRGDKAWVSVTDSGPGIAEEHVPLLFDRYWRGNSSGRAGTGLGLAIAKSIVEAHGGRIWVASEPAGGTTFIFSLPASPAASGIFRR